MPKILRPPCIRALATLAALFLSGSAAAADAPDDAERALKSQRASPRQLALVGLTRWNEGKAPDEAAGLFRQALERDPDEPYARLGMLLFDQRSLADRDELDQALEILRRTPSHPASRLASLSLLRLAGSSTRLDDRILAGLAELCGGPRGDCTSLGRPGHLQRMKGRWAGETRYRLLEARARIEV